jgi:transcriptional/translational regulatory protein YebC/TACO1
MENADIQFVPNSIVKLNDTDKEQLLSLVDSLEEDEDVSEVSHNADLY